MNDSTTSNNSNFCDARAEEISLLAAGCLTTQEEQELRAHLATCDVCRECFEQLQSVCSELRVAKPELDAVRFDLSAVTTVVAVAKPISQQRLGRIAAIVASVLAMLGLLMISGKRPTPKSPSRVIDVTQGSPAEAVPIVSQPIAQQPTLLALRQAAAISDDALDRLMTQSSVPMFSEPISTHPLLQESLR